MSGSSSTSSFQTMTSAPLLTGAQNQTLWKLFGPETETGRILRRMFASSQQDVAEGIKYPKLRTKQLVPEPTPKRNISTSIRYPKFRSRTIPAKPTHFHKGKRSINTINLQKALLRSTENEAPFPSKDMSLEKRRLQESFPFAQATVLPSEIAGPRVDPPTSAELAASMRASKKAETNKDEGLMLDILADIMEAQREIADASINIAKKSQLENRISRGLADLKVLTCSCKEYEYWYCIHANDFLSLPTP